MLPQIKEPNKLQKVKLEKTKLTSLAPPPKEIVKSTIKGENIALTILNGIIEFIHFIWSSS